MKRLAALLIAVVAAIALSCITAEPAQASVKMYACSGATDTYKAQFDEVRGQLKDGNVRYEEPRFYVESQSWLTPVGEMPGHESEHVHIAACIPQGETWLSPNDDRHLDIEFTFHNVQDYEATAIRGSFVTQTGSRGAFDSAEMTAALPSLNAAMELSGGLMTTKAFTSLKVRPSVNNGIKEMRWGITLVRDGDAALVEEWILDARWYVIDAYAGLPDATPLSEHVRYVRLRTIIDFFVDGVRKSDYHHSGWAGSEAWNRADLIALRPADWPVDLRVTDGGGGAALEIDPNHHVGPDNRGEWFTDFTMFSPAGKEELRTETVPTDTLSAGWHKLVFLSHDQPECDRLADRVCPPDVRPIWTNVNMLPFKVQ